MTTKYDEYVTISKHGALNPTVSSYDSGVAMVMKMHVIYSKLIKRTGF